MNESINIRWYGRCCFLVELGDKKILFDPYDLYCKVDIGLIEADILISSSSWHDHGHIGASPDAWIYTYPGSYNNGEIEITGIEAKEDRGTPTVVFNIRWRNFSLTNFADLGPVEKDYFDNNLNREQRDVLNSTNIAMMRPMIENREIGEGNVHNEIALDYCRPKVIIPEHYFPLSFIDEEVEEALKNKFKVPYKIVRELPEALGYEHKLVNDFKVTIRESDLRESQVYEFLKLHPQVTYKKDLNIVQKW